MRKRNQRHMEQRKKHPRTQLRVAQAAGLALATGLLAPSSSNAQTAPGASASPPGWQQCSSLTNDKDARLACFDQWAQRQPSATAAAASTHASPTSTVAPAAAAAIAGVAIAQAPTRNCKDTQFTTLSRFWELEDGTDCGTFTLRGYRPISLSVSAANGVNRLPTSDNPNNNATIPRDYQHGETRIQLSVRTKLAQGLLTQGEPMRKDSVWFGYTQQSYWQVFNSDLSRPFRNTDHEPEVVYIYPSDVKLPGGWRMRYSGAALTHQSNGQSLPLSRTWNRASLMAGFEKDDRFMLTAKLWKRMQEDAIKDDNPHIENYIGRAELAGAWNIDQKNTVAATLRHNLRSNGNGSLRLEWLSTLGTSSNSTIGSGLRFHTQLFTGYGDSLIDFNRRRTVLNVGLSLLDF